MNVTDFMPTPFQTDLLRRIEELAGRFGMSVEMSPQGKSELYFEGEIQPAGVRLWIYDDEAEFKSTSLHRLCEAPDFDGPEELATYFLEALAAELQR